MPGVPRYGVGRLRLAPDGRSELKQLITIAVVAIAALGAHGGHAQSPPIPRGGGAIPYPAGWNLVAGFTGAGGKDTVVEGADGPIYTLQPGDASYEVLPPTTPLEAGVGYWVHFSQPTSIAFPQGTDTPPVTRTLPPGKWVMIGDPFVTAAQVSGADVVDIYDAGGYKPASTLQAGQGAWAYSAIGGTVTLRSDSASQ